MFYYKLNLITTELYWHGRKLVKKKFNMSSMVKKYKAKKYPLWRVDLFFQKKYHDIIFIKNGGWHFTNIKTPEKIDKMNKFSSSSEYEESG